MRDLPQSESHNRIPNRIYGGKSAEERRVCRSQNFRHKDLVREDQLLHFLGVDVIGAAQRLKAGGCFIENRQIQISRKDQFLDLV
jgi:hypothetical protein